MDWVSSHVAHKTKKNRSSRSIGYMTERLLRVCKTVKEKANMLRIVSITSATAHFGENTDECHLAVRTMSYRQGGFELYPS